MAQSTKDLEASRSSLTFSPAALCTLLARNSANTGGSQEVRDRIGKIVENEPVFDKSKRPYMSRAEILMNGVKCSNRLLELKRIHKWTDQEFSYAFTALDVPTGLSLHQVAFTPVINAQGSDEQKAVWMQKCLNHEILGAYLQTELGHGSNVQRLETTATYIPSTQEFELHSPTISSTKWWIGALGLTATHGVVQARLLLNGKDLGPHLFICQVRSLKDHTLMPGITAGEIGPKAHGGMSATDNGWARFDHVRVPRSHMLSRFASVSASGEYKKPPHSKLSYGGMIYIRAGMASALGWTLARASTIGTRYLTQRRQFGSSESGGLETAVLQYPSVYMRILPQIARSVVYITIGKDMANLYTQMATLLATGDTTLLAETHAVSSGLKVYVSTTVVEGLEVVRRAMGGHGFMDASGVGRLYARDLPSATYEGDNFILNMQVARSALSSLANVRKNPSHSLAPSSAYLASLFAPPPVLPSNISFLAPDFAFQLLSRRAALQVERLERLQKEGRKWEDLSWECVEVCRSVVEVFLVDRIGRAVQEGGLLNSGVGAAEKEVLGRLISFYKLHLLTGAAQDFLEFGILPPSNGSPSAPLEVLRRELDVLAKGLLKDAVGLTDGFGFTDWTLDTSLGNYDGQAYERLLEKAQRDNDYNVGDASKRKELYDNYIKPILTRGAELSAAAATSSKL